MPQNNLDENLEELLMPILDKLEKGNLDLPLLPHVASQVLLLTSDPDADAAQLATLIQQDQALASQILRIANSPAYMSRTPIETLQQAIARMGLNLLAGMAFFMSTQSGVFNIAGYETGVKELWRHTLAVGLYGKTIAARIGQNTENAFLCGLLHAIGKPFAIHTVNEFRKDSETKLPWQVMVTIMKESYIEVGMQLGEAWQLPAPVKESIVLHQDHAYHLATSPTKGAPITCLGNHLAAYLFDESSIEEEALRALPVVKDLNLQSEDMEALLGMQDQVRASVETMLL